MHTKTLLICLLAMTTMSMASYAAAAEPATRIEGSLEMASAEVVAVDMATREVTLKGTDGEMLSFVAGPEVRNLAQVEVGDIVDVEYSQMLVTELHKDTSGMKKRIETVEAERAALGDKPAGVIRRSVDFSATVHAMDKEARTVTLLGTKGLVTFKVGSDIDLDKVSVGDLVEGSYVERLAISVNPR